MNAPKTLEKPANWQDFESLCKKLWGEEWQCPGIKKNGRAGQAQHGVDIYGIPKGQKGYWGIQCKGKDVFSHKQLTPNEIDSEIERAKLFKPKLEKLFFATTALKDVRVEEYIRIRNIELMSEGFFEIELYAWEDIIDLLWENKQTLNWYLGIQSFKQRSDVELFFKEKNIQLITSIPFVDETVTYTLQKVGPEVYGNVIAFIPPDNPIRVNQSLVAVRLILENTGGEPIENAHIILTVDSAEIVVNNMVRGRGKYMEYIPTKEIRNYTILDRSTIKLIPNPILVSGETYLFDVFFLQVTPQEKEIEISISWRLLSRQFQKENILKILITPEIYSGQRQQPTIDHKLVGTKHKTLTYVLKYENQY